MADQPVSEVETGGPPASGGLFAGSACAIKQGEAMGSGKEGREMMAFTDPKRRRIGFGMGEE